MRSAGTDALAWALAAIILVCAALAWIHQDVKPPPPVQDNSLSTVRGQPFNPDMAWMAMDVDLLADVAMGEDHDALAAVMWTVLNRRRPGETLERVIQRGHHYGTMRGGRFLPSWSRVPGRRWARHYPGRWVNAQEVAWRVLLGLQGDVTGGSTHFHRSATWTPPWAPPDPSDWVLFGSHYFYQAGA